MDNLNDSTPTILFILHLPPPVHGAAMMGKYIKDSKRINEAFDCHFINLATASGLEDIGKAGLGKAVRYAKLLRHVRQEVKRLRPGLVYVTPNAAGPAFYKDYVLVQMLKRMGCRVVCHYHNKGVASRQDRKLDDWLYRRFFRGIKVILLAEVLYKDVAKYVSREDVTIVPNGIPDITTLPEKQHSNDVPQLLFLSNLIESKGVIDLLDACKILKERGCKFVCNFVGGETSEINAERFAKEAEMRGLAGVAIYKGSKFGEDKVAEIAKSDMLVFPTHNEAFPLVLLEAMRQKLPVVTTEEGATAEEIGYGEAGLVAQKGDPSDLAKCIKRLIDDPQLAIQLGEEGRKRFEQLYTIGHWEEAIAVCLSNLKSGGVIVKYLGSLYGDNKIAVLASSDCLVFPTHYPKECFPLVLLEAMQCGLTCISTAEAGIPDIIEDGKTGLIVPPSNPEALADAIEKVVSDKALCREMGEQGRRRYEELFTLGKFEENMSAAINHYAE